MLHHIPYIEQRRVEAKMLRNVYEVLKSRSDETRALDLVRIIVEKAALEEGQAFALTAPDGKPSLEHFSQIADTWGENGALKFSRRELSGSTFILDVSSCAYARMYLDELGLSPSLAQTLGCHRDLAFAKGYSPHLQLARSSTLVENAAQVCPFRYVWTESRHPA
ncbi:L-2-amino-thiazoline-4-carboxylic acid hydrolase [Desulfobaculum bizertense]|uniref:L-2-amino-thiazoline-4-carboxylic acid hydrolase n=1 Tax=Desulfobaculum bizertense DSM 18034 TaxID=1121442 RepID=A0A1T4W222_9BACT|nr:L-2-amino-thiazoline-4-carboxylic acid hydrolase [Desulfobaculum bizertense]UIJ38880.1 L-2-amino-thiazoline-4-carboxylic acid hydrolase [Desulfobaculum bizertense]SKA71237.1 L-2-amino-thiazoline-4-carboxylic acid hydrolase [Desulfobaculum bizertense DSM 18034]